MEVESFDLRFGSDGDIGVTVAKSRLVARFSPPAAIVDVKQAATAAAGEPRDYPPLHQCLVPGDRIAIVVDRSTPQAASIIAGLWPEFERREIAPDDVTILHPADVSGASVSDPRVELPDAIRESVRWHVHDPLVAASCTYLATTAAGERVYLSRELVDADAAILVGCVEFDRLWGYRGLQSSLYPGLSTVESMRKSHGQPHDELEIDDPRPLRQQADEIGWLLGAQFGVAVVAAGGEGVSAIHSGQPDVAFRKAVESLNASWRVKSKGRPELVVIALDSASGARGWDQLSHALFAARDLVAKDGRIVVLSQFSTALGEGMELLRDSRTPRDAMKPLRERMPPDLLAATSLARAVEWANVYLQSGLEPDLVEDLFMVPISGEAEFQRLVAGDEPIAVIESGQHVCTELLPIRTRSK